MLYTIAVILLVAWLLGFVGIYTVGSFIHVLLVVAIVLFLVGLLGGRRVLGEVGRPRARIERVRKEARPLFRGQDG
ncbi:MAG TPA: lmo0937 family membrane protein [Vicinamibacterales bacterium]|nr:lmo0937 family membrane protein [Vicinamibacterales bacterium]